MRSLLMSKVSPGYFSPELIAIMKSALDTAVHRIERSHRTPATKQKWRSGLSKRPLKA
jgi:hypothetical protein